MLTDRVSPKLTPQFYDAVKVKEENPVVTQKVTWVAFPKRVGLAAVTKVLRC
jgi:hypothetical protein